MKGDRAWQRRVIAEGGEWKREGNGRKKGLEAGKRTPKKLKIHYLDVRKTIMISPPILA